MPEGDVTQYLVQARDGVEGALNSVYEILFADLERAARAQLARHHGQTINTHGLINESFLKLSEQERVALDNRNHFLAVASKAMRHILVDYFRQRVAEKRGGGAVQVTWVDDHLGASAQDEQLLAIDEALARLSEENQRLAEVVECKFFGGMKYDEIAGYLGVSARTVRLDWKKAKAWLTLDLETDA